MLRTDLEVSKGGCLCLVLQCVLVDFGTKGGLEVLVRE